MLYRTRKYLPHLESPNGTYFVTFRLSGSLPKKITDGWKSERREILLNADRQGRVPSPYEQRRIKYLYSEKIEKYLDSGIGECWLRNPAIAELTVNTLKYFDGERYVLDAWCVMPNHVHVVCKILNSESETQSDLAPLLHSWRSFIAHQANKILGRTGKFWHGEYYDHLIRNDEDFARCVHYTIENPVIAGLCSDWFEWPWTGCSERINELLLG